MLNLQFHISLFVNSILASVLLVLTTSCGADERTSNRSVTSEKSVPEFVDFNFHVKPILSDRCFKCHGPDENALEAGLRLDIEEGAFAALGEKEDHYAIVPGKPEESTMVQRIFSEEESEVMPPPGSNLKLEAHEKEILKKWIAQGAQWKEHWSFIPPDKNDLPAVQKEDWVINEIDNFILARLEKEGLQPSEPAKPEVLLRRLSFDLTGLPPTLKEMNRFLQNEEGNAYEKMVDHYLNTDAYAENMTAKWLDIARYADTHGYQDDLERVMWPWRDWVIHAFRNNMPFDQFVKWQLAGDLLPSPTREQVIATAFNRNHKITQEGGVIPEEYRVEYVADRTQTYGTTFLGLTMECARCHDHKYDPVSQKNYYQLFSFFNNVPEQGLIEEYGAIPEPFIMLTDEEIAATLNFINNRDSLEKIPLMVMEEMEKPRPAFVLNRGAYDQPAEEVEPATPEALLEFSGDLSPNRLGLADWTFSKDNPLTARVTVNRLWQQVFGRGIVSTTEDFGNQGALPTHPKLLDWLAVDFRENDWDLKAIIKKMVMSQTYRQQSVVTPELKARDPENLLLARAPRVRLTAEMIRDHILASSGLLVKEIGGPSVKPYQPEGIWEETTGGGGGSTSKYVQGEGEDLYRRSIYTFWKRTVPPPNMMTFDAASRDFCVVRRQRTSTPLQALVMMNDPQVLEACRVMAHRSVQKEKTTNERIQFMFRLATSRYPDPEELEALAGLFREELERFKSDPEAARELLDVGEYELDEKKEMEEVAALTIIANVIYNLDETITKS